MLNDIGLSGIEVGPPIDTFGGSAGETNARAFDVHGHPFLARKPSAS
jgi:hypothetical protein